MVQPLDGCWEKIRRAKEHLAQLELEFTPSPNNDLYKAITEHKGNPGEYVITARLTEAAFVRWAVICGEIAHDLRSALDHAVCAIARKRNPMSDCEGLSFPIYTFPPVKGHPRKELKAMGNSKAEALIESVQPHVAGNGAERHPLYVLHRLNIWDKHRDIPLGVVSLRIEPNVSTPDQPYRATIGATTHVLNDGTVQLTLVIADPSGMEMKSPPALFIRFDQPTTDHPEPFGYGVPVLRVLDDCTRVVEDVISRLAPIAAS